ncbi:MAG: ABC transporter ATP-binding protein [Phycisphaerae bacterium]|nr:ABC transporter ATP-binding protein [Phycisphaerae bacterium]
MPVLRLSNIGFRRGERQILSSVSWTIEPGQHWALLGANGSGKTTLLKIVTGYEWVSEGSVEALGQLFGECDLRTLRKSIGWVSSALVHTFPGRDTAESVVLSGLEASIGLYRDFTAEESNRARHTLALMGAEHLAEQPYELMSQGEQQRVLIARALVNQPTLLILDEPCAGLDPAARNHFLFDVGQLAQRPQAPTLIVVTHHIEEIHPWITHVLVLKEGRVLATGPKETVLTSAHLSTAFSFDCHVRQDGRLFYLAGPA